MKCSKESDTKAKGQEEYEKTSQDVIHVTCSASYYFLQRKKEEAKLLPGSHSLYFTSTILQHHHYPDLVLQEMQSVLHCIISLTVDSVVFEETSLSLSIRQKKVDSDTHS